MINKEVSRLKMYCQDYKSIENYDNAISDKENIWDCHHSGEILPCGKFSRDTLKKYGLYYNRPASELIFLTHSEHIRIHRTGKHHSDDIRMKISLAEKGKKMSEDSRMKISESNKGKPAWNKGKHHTEESKRKMSQSLKGRVAWNKGIQISEEQKKKISESHKGKPAWNKGKHHTEESKRKMSEAKKGRTLSYEHRRKLSLARKAYLTKKCDLVRKS